ncbi:hypothetical protein EGT07_05365 [Herbaspirillum sp. HC18]|nr:hypothetical protein EGT07_05365 [Herbaspirillum sp. HC18]
MSKIGAKVMSIGKQSAQLQLATKRDIPGILELYYSEGWIDYSYEELEYLFEASPNCCFKLTTEGKLIGVNFATVVDNGICYPHSNLLSSEYRSKINYFDEAIKYNDYLKTLSKLDILYAAKKVIRLYESGGGFIPLDYYRRASINVPAIELTGNSAREAIAADYPTIHAFCREIYNAGRENLIQYFVNRGIAKPFVLPSYNGGISAFAMVRRMPKYHMIGPVLANDEMAAARVIAAAACSQPDATVMIEGDEKKLSLLLDNHFSYQWEENVMLKMYRGDKSSLEDESRIYSIFARYTS